MRRRERIEIIYDILKVIQDKGGKAKPTHILYKSNLSSQMLKEYLNYLIEKNFLQQTKDSKSKFYTLTDKGYKYIEDYSTIKKFMDSYDLNEES